MTTSQFIPVSESKGRIGKRIKNLHQIRDASRAKQSLVVLHEIYKMKTATTEAIGYHGPYPAAFMLNRIGSNLCILLDRGIFIYQPKTRRKGVRKGFMP